MSKQVRDFSPAAEALSAVIWLVGIMMSIFVLLMGPTLVLSYYHFDEGWQAAGSFCGMLLWIWLFEYVDNKWLVFAPDI